MILRLANEVSIVVIEVVVVVVGCTNDSLVGLYTLHEQYTRPHTPTTIQSTHSRHNVQRSPHVRLLAFSSSKGNQSVKIDILSDNEGLDIDHQSLYRLEHIQLVGGQKFYYEDVNKLGCLVLSQRVNIHMVH